MDFLQLNFRIYLRRSGLGGISYVFSSYFNFGGENGRNNWSFYRYYWRHGQRRGHANAWTSSTYKAMHDHNPQNQNQNQNHEPRTTNTTKPYLHKRGNRASIHPDELFGWCRWCNIVPQDNDFHAPILAAIRIA